MAFDSTKLKEKLTTFKNISYLRYSTQYGMTYHSLGQQGNCSRAVARHQNIQFRGMQVLGQLEFNIDITAISPRK